QTRVPSDRDDEQETEKGVAGVERWDRRVWVRVDQPRDRDRVVAVRAGGVRCRVVRDADQTGQQPLLTRGPRRRRRKQQEGERPGEGERDQRGREPVEQRPSLDPQDERK